MHTQLSKSCSPCSLDNGITQINQHALKRKRKEKEKEKKKKKNTTWLSKTL